MNHLVLSISPKGSGRIFRQSSLVCKLVWAIWAYCLGAPLSEEFDFDFESHVQVPSMPPTPLHSTKDWFRDMKMIGSA